MAGILDDYFNPALYSGQGGGILSRLPELMAQPGPSQGFPPGQQGAPGSLDPRWLEWLKGGPVPGAAPPAPQAQAPIFPGMGSMGGAAGYGAGMDAPQQQADPAQLPQTAAPTVGQGALGIQPQGAPQQASAESPGLGDRLGAGLQGFGHGGGSLMGSMEALFGGLATGQRQDNQGIMQRALMAKGWTPDMAKAATSDPAIMQQIIPSLFGPKNLKWTQTGEDMMGNKQFGFVDEATGRIVQPGANGGGPPGSSPGMPGTEASYLAPGVKQIDSSLTGDAYLKQFSPEVQAAVNNYVSGQSMPTGNPRKGFTQTIKMIAQKYGQDTGQQVDDTTFAARRTMRTQLSSAAPNSLGGQINVGNTAIGHLSDLSEKALALGNYDIGIAPISQGINAVRGLGSGQSAKMDALKDAAQHYGQEVTKFYAGSPGGVAERDRFMEAIGATKTPQALAAVIATEAELMHSRLKALESQISGTLGPQGSQQYPVVRPESQKALEKIDANVSRLKTGGAAPSAAAPAAPGVDRAALEAEARRRGLIK